MIACATGVADAETGSFRNLARLTESDSDLPATSLSGSAFNVSKCVGIYDCVTIGFRILAQQTWLSAMLVNGLSLAVELIFFSAGSATT